MTSPIWRSNGPDGCYLSCFNYLRSVVRTCAVVARSSWAGIHVCCFQGKECGLCLRIEPRAQPRGCYLKVHTNALADRAKANDFQASLTTTGSFYKDWVERKFIALIFYARILNSRARRSLKRFGFRSSHSQTVKTCQPSCRNRLALCASRERFLCNFGTQKS